MKLLRYGATALFLIALSIAGPVSVTDGERTADAIRISAEATLQADVGGLAGDFIKPTTAAPLLSEPPEEQRVLDEGTAALERRGSGPFPSYSFHFDQPDPLSASVRRAHLNVYRL